MGRYNPQNPTFADFWATLGLILLPSNYNSPLTDLCMVCKSTLDTWLHGHIKQVAPRHL